MLDEPNDVMELSTASDKVDTLDAGVAGSDRAWCGSWADALPGHLLAERFEEMYVSARGEPERVPWARGKPHPLLIDWLNTDAARLVRPGSRALVVGCGLGDDVVELVERGYDVMGIDIAPTAVRWAAKRHPRCADHFIIADLLNPPSRLRRRFDLVIEVNTLQSLPPGLRAAGAASLAGLMAPRATLVTIGRGRCPDRALEDFVSPPFPFTCAELTRIMLDAGLHACHSCPEPVSFVDDQDTQSLCLRAVFGAC